MEIKVLNKEGKATSKKVSLTKDIFAIEPNDHAIYLDVKQYLANQRQGTHQSRERGDIAGSTRKIKKQKGTGTARAGSIKNPLLAQFGQKVVWITYPPGERKFQLIIEALTKGFDVIIEKPIQMSPKEIQKIQKTILFTGNQLAVNFQYVFCNRVSQLAKETETNKKFVFEGNFFAISKNDLSLSISNCFAASTILSDRSSM